MTEDSWKQVLGTLVSGSDLSFDQAFWAMNEMMSGTATDSQLAGLVIGLRVKGETPQEVSGMVKAMLANAIEVNLDRIAVDVVGTGRMPLAAPGVQAMPKMPSYNAEETAALAAYIATLGAGPGIPTAEMLDTTNAELALGGELFRTNCAQCHGASAVGGALSEGRKAPSLMDADAKNLYEAMVTGPQSMPVFADSTLSVEDKQHIIAYVAELQKNESPGGFSLGRLGPVTEGLFIFTIGLGVLIVAAVWIGAKAK